MRDDILDYFGDFDDLFDKDTKVVAVKFFYFESEARVYAARLKQAGIKNFISSSHVSSMLPMGEGGIGLHVKEEDQQQALEIIHQLDNNNNLEFVPHQENGKKASPNSPMPSNQNKLVSYFIYFFIALLIILAILRTYLRATGAVNTWWDFF